MSQEHFSESEINKRMDTHCPNCKKEIRTYHDNTEPEDETMIASSHGIDVKRIDAMICCEHCEAWLEMTEIIIVSEYDNEIVENRAWRLTGFYLQGHKI